MMERVRKGSDLPKKKWGSLSIQQKYSHTKLTQRSSALYFGLCVLYIRKYGATLLVGAWQREKQQNKLVE